MKHAHGTHLHPLQVFLIAVNANQTNTATHHQNYVQHAQVGKKCYIKQQVPSQPAPNVTPVNFKIFPAMQCAKIARKVFIKMTKVSRIALAAAQVSTKTKKGKTRAKNAA